MGGPTFVCADDLPQRVPYVSYCTAKVNSCGGQPSISSSGAPHASATSGFVVSADQARGQKFGLFVYGDKGRAADPFQGGLLCVGTPLRRSVPVRATGTPGICNGTFALDMSCFASGGCGGNPAPFLLVPGTRVSIQCWGRDTVANGSYLSNALEFDVCL
jgi:hypothetical protein